MPSSPSNDVSPPEAPQRLFESLQGCSRVLLTGPLEPDGDSVGACLALQRLLHHCGVDVDVGGIPTYRYLWMPGAADMIPDQDLRPDYDAVVVLDGDRHRLTREASAAFARAGVKGIVDHHASTRSDGYTHAWIDPEATSVCEMLYELVVAKHMDIDHDLAALLYVGAIFDTGGFRYSNTTPATHRMAARLLEVGIDHAGICARILLEHREPALRVAGEVYSNAELHLDGTLSIGSLCKATAKRLRLVPGDLEGLVDSLVYTSGVEVAVLLVERAPRLVKASLRSRGRVNVASVAQMLSPSGGGHTKAAGAVIEATLAESRQRVVDVVTPELRSSHAAAG
ncbi:MAG: bifunctional oligoribonuclease/PAP phosphatase NrnA [Deltaproteobacteria bacterium]|nr:bifunctional oligoribonuclease/PAP phosphatase NrnA [Deltaproteobacteria bacterium]